MKPSSFYSGPAKQRGGKGNGDAEDEPRVASAWFGYVPPPLTEATPHAVSVIRRRDRLVALLWSERDDTQARANLRQALWILRKSLDGIDPLPLVSEGEAVGLDGSAIWVDAVRFQDVGDRA